MGFFSGRHSVEDERPVVPEKTVVQESPRRSHTLLSRRRDVSPPMSDVSSVTTERSRGGVFHRGSNTAEDASIVAAKERVSRAEAAEREADKALLQARAAVKEAWEHIKRLEAEAAEDARLAKIKQNQAAAIGKRARPLGRHDR